MKPSSPTAALEGRVCVVTGAASGIGKATALLLAQSGARVAALDIDETVGVEIADQLGKSGLFMLTDMTNAQAVDKVTKKVLENFGVLHAWINVAGGSGRRFGDGPTAECSEEGWERTIELNLKTAFIGCRAALRAMTDTGEAGRSDRAIVNISSILGLVGGDADFATHAYAASKGGVISLTRAIATYYAPQGIRANVICPGLIATPMSARAQMDERIRARLTKLQPLTGDFGRPEDVAHAACFLASEAAAFITGAVLTVDGGWTVQ